MDYASRSRSWLDEWMFGKIIEETLIEMELDEGQAQEGLLAVRALISQQAWALKSKKAPKILTSWLRDEDIQRLLGVNRYQGILWFNKEAYERLLRWMLAIAVVTTLTNETLTNKQKDKAVQTQWVLIQKLEQAALASEYQVEKLIQAAKE